MLIPGGGGGSLPHLRHLSVPLHTHSRAHTFTHTCRQQRQQVGARKNPYQPTPKRKRRGSKGGGGRKLKATDVIWPAPAVGDPKPFVTLRVNQHTFRAAEVVSFCFCICEKGGGYECR